MTTEEKVEQLRTDVDLLRTELEILKSSSSAARDTEAAARAEARAEMAQRMGGLPSREEFLVHMSLMEKKLEEDTSNYQEDVKKLQKQLAEHEGEIARVKSSTPSHAFEASATKLHLTQRKGFYGLGTYGGGAQWADLRFSTVRWLQQEHKEFEGLLHKIERLKK